jgi:serine/threonine protein phosphatase 1
MRHFRFGKRTPRLPDDLRIYAIGDVHGCFNLLAELLQRIEVDCAKRGITKTKLVLLGDLIDRGPQSAQVCNLLYDLRDSPDVICLKGNHEAAMVDALNGNFEALRFWLAFGGVTTLASWGVDQGLIDQACLGDVQQYELLQAARDAVPGTILDWLNSLPLSYAVGDYFFVHAGIRPGVPLNAQKEEDLLWIREPFLSSWKQHEATIVHGHSEAASATLGATRIGIDTAAYRTGRLTALGLEGTEQWPIYTTEPEAGVPLKLADRVLAWGSS